MRSLADSCRSSRRRGAALLIVLGALVVSMTAATILLSAATDKRVQRGLARSEAIAFDLLHASEAPIQHWLEHDSTQVVLAPDVGTPKTLVLADKWEADNIQITLVITAFDQLGMAPMQAARSGSPLRLALPMEVTTVLDSTDLPPSADPTPLGLDLVRSAALVGNGSALRIFPAAEGNAEQDIPALGGLVATHNRDPVRINVNTATRPLLEAALRAAGRGGVDSILASRASGKAAGPAGQETTETGSADSNDATIAPRLVSASDCWAFRVDVDIRLPGMAGLKRSWWAIYRPGPDDPHTSAHERWQCVQRLSIDA